MLTFVNNSLSYFSNWYLHTWARSNPKGWSEVGGGEGGYPADKISTMIRKDVTRGTRKFSQNSDHFAWTNTYMQMRGRDFFVEDALAT